VVPRVDVANTVKDTSSYEKDRTLGNLPDFLEAFSESPEKLGSAPKRNGSPHTIVVAGAGLRAADLVRYAGLAISEFLGG